MHCVIGTAGHIDSGKTALVTALTGYNPDRLKEEQERGMTTDLGFAFYGENATIIDVPGHERFVRHMIAGAQTIDLVLLVVSCNEGVQLQTIEHFEITKILGIKRGIIVLTKKDTVEREFLPIVEAEVRDLIKGSYLEKAPTVAVSVLTGEGVQELKGILDKMIEETPPKEDRGYFRMPIDRSFRIKGFGQVVAGTILSGSCRVGDTLEILPKGVLVRVRGIQRHKKEQELVGIGERAAINLLGHEKEEILRGDVLVEPKSLRPTHFFNGYFTALRSNPMRIKKGMKVKLHIGTKETLASLIPLAQEEIPPGESDYVQIFTEEMVVCEVSDRFVCRSFSPPLTIGGGKVLEIAERKAKRNDPTLLRHLSRLNSEEKKTQIDEIINHAGFYPISEKELGKRVGLANLSETLSELKKEGRIIEIGDPNSSNSQLINSDNYERAKEKIKRTLEDYHKENPYKSGMRLSELTSRLENEMANALLEKIIQGYRTEGTIIVEKETVKIAGFEITLSAEEKKIAEKVISLLKKEGFSPPSEKEISQQFPGERKLSQVIAILKATGDLVEISGYLFPKETIERAKEILISLLQEKKAITASEYRLKLNTTRKYVIPLLNYFDSSGITVRRGELRILR